ncbi:hypothetical protein DFP72DRAFT_87369 [Ephemerocybe angulata]|uniref:F-box domain-containing protein n=1 Tax=Ephemerocybe angulata TaxID=980116 RepID=A0A8H6LUB5_9AGAR|nr:hypothetical protein DFP72DRAFT_87369 [Tulosesus angulatus]
MVLCRVCKEWKEVAEAYSPLWATLRLFIMELPGDDDPNVPDSARPHNPLRALEQGVANCLRTWKRKTKASSIQLQIIFLQRELYRGPSLLGTLGPTDFQRITKLSLCRVRYRDVSQLPRNGFPALEDLILTIYNVGDYRKKTGPIRAFEESPLLRRVAVDELVSGGFFPVLALPWRQLSHLVLKSPIPTEFFNTHLSDCPHLSHLSVLPGYDSLRWGHSIPKQTWSWPNITNITIGVWEYAGAGFSFPFLLGCHQSQRVEILPSCGR